MFPSFLETLSVSRVLVRMLSDASRLREAAVTKYEAFRGRAVVLEARSPRELVEGCQ